MTKTPTHKTEPIDADEAELRRHLLDAQLPALLLALTHVTGDESLLGDSPRPEIALTGEPQGGYDDGQIETARERCLDALVRYRDRGCPAPSHPTPEQLHRWLSFLVEEDQLDEYGPLLLDELALDGPETRAPRWRKSEIAPERPFTVAIIGAGMSGLAAAVRLQQAEIPFVIFERNEEVGGTWHDNIYPGCRVDVSSHFYSYSFARGFEWPQLFSPQKVLLEYFKSCADSFGLREQIRFGTEVTEAVFDEDAGTWTLSLQGPECQTDAFEANVLVSGMGQLNRPNMPEIEGMDRFRGAAFHSAQWDPNVSFEGKRVAIIGTGSSACQFIPPVADQASELTVFQRTAPWLLPTPNYHDAVPEGLVWLFRHVPFYAEWYRFWLFWTTAESMLPAVEVEEDWPHKERSVGARNDETRAMLTEYLRGACNGDEALFAKMLPDYPPFAKRFVRDNGILPATYARDHVTLETEGIERITETGIRTRDGRDLEVDVLIYGTGFTASEFLMPLKVVGRGGRNLHEVWDGDARAYLGITLPRFPNLFLLYGPNTNIVVNGSIIFFTECEVDYLVAAIRELLEGEHRAMDCRQAVHDAYNERIDAANLRRAWGAATVNSWYKNETGRVSQNWPFNLLEFWKQTRAPDPADYDLI
jgi:4-hydroxyacetophenone monooxygenase